MPLFAFVASLLIHVLVLMIPQHEPSHPANPPRLEARLRQADTPEAQAEAIAPQKPSTTKAQRPRLLTTDKPGRHSVASAPRWSEAEKAEMNRFLNELDQQAKAAPKPTLAQRSLAMARADAIRQAREDTADSATLDLRPDAPPPNPFSLEMYLDGLLKRLNRSAGFVRNDPRAKGVQQAAIEFKLNPDGTMKSFRIINAGDQAEEIAFVKSVVERSIPFAPFPPDIDKAARALTMRICIRPAHQSEGGFGFTRAGGHGC
jgi:hypothetical protein